MFRVERPTVVSVQAQLYESQLTQINFTQFPVDFKVPCTDATSVKGRGFIVIKHAILVGSFLLGCSLPAIADQQVEIPCANSAQPPAINGNSVSKPALVAAIAAANSYIAAQDVYQNCVLDWYQKQKADARAALGDSVQVDIAITNAVNAASDRSQGAKKAVADNVNTAIAVFKSRKPASGIGSQLAGDQASAKAAPIRTPTAASASKSNGPLGHKNFVPGVALNEILGKACREEQQTLSIVKQRYSAYISQQEANVRNAKTDCQNQADRDLAQSEDEAQSDAQSQSNMMASQLGGAGANAGFAAALMVVGSSMQISNEKDSRDSDIRDALQQCLDSADSKSNSLPDPSQMADRLTTQCKAQ